MQVQVVYASRHGASRRYAEAIAEVLEGEAQSIDAVKSFWGDAIVFVTGVYGHSLNKDMIQFLAEHRSELYGRMWAGVAVSLIPGEVEWHGSKIGGPIYVRQYLQLLERPPLALADLPGAVSMNTLNDEEREQVNEVFEILGMTPADLDKVDPTLVWKVANRIKEIARQC
ncbi:hypothetical protein HPY42_05915 [Coprothermobacteraceae bacterium]|nr:hypothetical protein [Coprothermobacteraceae bacterium]